MKTKPEIKKIAWVVIGIYFVIASLYLFFQHEYIFGTLLTFSLLFWFKADAITELAISMSDGARAKFQISPEKIEENIKENKEPITNQSFISFKNIETKILSELQKRYGGEMKSQIHLLCGEIDKPEFRYTPDGGLMTKDTLYFFEIKYVSKPEFAEKIINNAISYLKLAYEKIAPTMGHKRLEIKLIIASSFDLDITNYSTPRGIVLELFKI